MDNNLWIYLIGLAIYFILMSRLKKKRQGRARQERAQKGRPSALDEALRQIGAALGEEEDIPIESPTPVRLEQRVRPQLAPPVWASENVTREFAPIRPMGPAAQKPSAATNTSPSPRESMMRQLREPDAARRAIILSEILGAPHAKRQR